jgi:hypothetical protein
MARKPTRAEVIATNANMKQECDSCGLVVKADKYYGTFPNMLTLTASGGYGEFVDSFDESPEFVFNLCHKCGHKFLKGFFPHWSFRNWHEQTKDKFCQGWKFKALTDEEFEKEMQIYEKLKLEGLAD